MQNYKIDQSFRLIGSFWPSSSPDSSFTGTLISRKGKLSIDGAPTFSTLDGTELFFREASASQSYETLNSFTEDCECTVFGVYEINPNGLTHFPSSKKITASRRRAFRAIMGLTLDSPEAEVIDSACVYFRKLHRWLPSPWHTKHQKKGLSLFAPFKPRQIFELGCIALEATLRLEVDRSGKQSTRKEAVFMSVPRLVIEPKTPRSAAWYHTLAFRAENFFSLILGSSLSIKRVQFHKGDSAGWLIQHTRRRDTKLDYGAWINCSPEKTALALCHWLSFDRENQAIERSILGNLRKSVVFDETEFLSLAQAIEGFARFNFPNLGRSANFEKLLDSTVALMPPSFADKLLKDPNTFQKRLRNTRNHLTHIGIPKRAFVIEDRKELFLMNQTLRAFLRCLMLIQIGFGEAEYGDAILHQSSTWK